MSDSLSPAELALREAARDYHRLPTRGKISVNATKPLSNQRDLSLAYSPASPTRAWTFRPTRRWRMTSPRAAI